MITLFKANETNFSHDGVEVLDDIIVSSYTTWSENGKWISESKFKKDYDKSESIKEGMILQLPTEKGLQPFKILKVTKKNKKYITAKGHHIGFEFENNFIQDINIVNKGGRAAIKQIQGGTVYNCKYSLSSNIDTVSSARMVRKNGITSLVGSDDNCFINRWGGYLVLDNFNISMNTSVGQDRGVEVLIGKNLTDMEGSIDISSVVTGINPITYDGLTLPEGIYYSPLVNNYPEPRIKEFKFDDIKYKYSENNYDEEGYETLEEVYEAIRKACDDLYNNSNIDKPTCNLRVSIIDLTKTDQYKGIELNERIFQGDIVTANLEEYGFNVKLKMTANKYNNIKDCYEDFDLGDVKTNVFSSIGKIQSTVDKVIEQLGGNTWQDILDKSMKEATELIEAGIKGSYVVARKNEILIMDSYNVESAINVIRINKNGLAFSQNGYSGNYTLAITIDGKINASCITTGELNAALIKTGILMSANSKSWIDMENGTFNFGDLFNFDGVEMKMKDTGFKIVDADDNIIAYIGQDNWMRLQGLMINGHGECLQNKGTGARSLKLTSTDGGSNYIDFNENDTDNYTIRLIREGNSKALKCLAEIFEVRSYTGATPAGVKIRSNGETAYLDFVYNASDDYNARLCLYNNDRNIHALGTGFTVHGNLQVTGNKNCIQTTENYGQVSFYATEDCESYFTDRSMEVFTVEESEAGSYERVILLDNAFKESVNITDYPYTVEVIKQSWGDYRIKEQTTNYFIIESDRKDFTFKYIVTARRKGYENARLEECFLEDESGGAINELQKNNS